MRVPERTHLLLELELRDHERACENAELVRVDVTLLHELADGLNVLPGGHTHGPGIVGDENLRKRTQCLTVKNAKKNAHYLCEKKSRTGEVGIEMKLWDNSFGHQALGGCGENRN